MTQERKDCLMSEKLPVLFLTPAAEGAAFYDARLGEVIVGQVYLVENQNTWSCFCWLSGNMKTTKGQGPKTGHKSKDDAIETLRRLVLHWMVAAGVKQ